MNILFLCVANSARSQMAEGIARHVFGAAADVRSAGSEPSGTVNPLAVAALEEKGIDISEHYSKAIDALDKAFLDRLDYAVTLCAEEVCPVLASRAKKLHWPNPDPAAMAGGEAEKVAAFRTARDAIEAKVRDLWNSLNAESIPSAAGQAGYSQ